MPRRLQVLLVVICCCFLYGNTLRNTYALDDEVIIVKNLNVQKGFSGIKEIFTKDAFQGYFDYIQGRTSLEGGRYRPLSIVTFAIEQQVFGITYGTQYAKLQKELERLQRQGNSSASEITELLNKKSEIEVKMVESNASIAMYRHFIQIVFFTLSMIVLLYFLSDFIFRDQPLLGLFTVLLFVFHPVHTEVVANLKSRDEIFSLLFISLTCLYYFKHVEDKSFRSLLLCLVFFLCALLSKEYAMILPFILAAGLYIFYKADLNTLFKSNVKWLFVISFLFAILRFAAFHTLGATQSNTEVLNDPFLYANGQEKIASKVSLILQYGRVLLYPKNLSYDYSYNQLPYLNFSDCQVWLSLVIYAGLFYLCWLLLRKRHVLGFAIVIFLGFLMLVNNLLFNIGATIGERLIYHSSLGFCMVVVWIFSFFIHKVQWNSQIKSVATCLICLGVFVPLSIKTIQRNKAWYNDSTLNRTDVHTVPESASSNNNAGSAIINDALKVWLAPTPKSSADSAFFHTKIDTAFRYFKKAIAIYPKFLNATMNMGVCYDYLGEYDSSAFYFEKSALLFNGPNSTLQFHARKFLDRGLELGHEKKYEESIIELERANKIYAYDAYSWNNLGGAYFMARRYKDAIIAFDHSLELNPELIDSKNGKKAAEHFSQIKKED